MDRLVEGFARIALEAGRTILEIYEVGPKVQIKADRSPVCDADEAAEAIILSALERLCPNLPIIAEEALARGQIPEIGGDFILVDPLDGTREFLSRNGEFTINIGLIHDATPCCGVVYAPALGRFWAGGTIARAVEATPGAVLPPIDSWRPIKARQAPQDVRIPTR
jgi:3'-phosphoadenosine 5'-phosphosulfate (PAPS) 3'-phosphatase